MILRRIFQSVRAPEMTFRVPEPTLREMDLDPNANLAPYEEPEAVVDALAGEQACEHGIWPHQGKCVRCLLHFSFGGLFGRDVQ